MNNSLLKTILVSNRAKLSIAALALVAATTAGTMAVVSDNAKTDVSITSATFGMTINDNNSEGVYDVNIDSKNLAPGETRSGAIKVTNDSTIPAKVSVSKSKLTNFTANIKDSLDEEFTSVTIPAKESVDLTLTVGLPVSTTDSPLPENVTVTFNAEQESYK